MSYTLTSGYQSVTTNDYTAEVVIAAVLLTLCFLTVIAIVSVPEIAEAFGAVSLLS
jgi:Na+/proline symporter